jgi:hypothetical protein
MLSINHYRNVYGTASELYTDGYAFNVFLIQQMALQSTYETLWIV